MRTTITIPDEIVRQALAITGKTRVSEAVAEILDESIKRKKQLSLLKWLRENPVPHKMSAIKRTQRQRQLSTRAYGLACFGGGN